MKKSLCKLISIVLALAMTVGLLPVSALAAPDVDAVDGETASTADFYVDATVVESGDGSADAPFATLDEALKAAAKVDGAVIHVVGELTVSGAVDIAAYYNNEANSDYDVTIVGDALHFDEGAMITVSAPDVPEVEAEGDTADEPEADTETEEVTGDTVPEVAGDTEEVTEGEPETRPEAENEDAPETQSEEKSEDAPAEVTADEVNDTPAEPTADEVEDEPTDEPAGNTEDVDEPEDVDAPADGNDTADEPANTSDDEPADGSDITTPAPVAYTGTATLKDILVTGSLAVDGVELENVTVAGGSFDVYGVSAQVVMPVALSTVDGVLAVKVTPSATAPIDAGGASLQTVATGVQSYELSAFSVDGTEGYELVWSDGESLHNVATDEIVDFEGEVPQVYTLLIMTIEEPSESKFNDSNSIFVDGTKGNDSSAGTRENPVKTLDTALNKVTTSRNTLVLLGDTTYSDYLGSNSATSGKSITICSESAKDIHTVTVQQFTTASGNSQFHLKDNRSMTLENVTICCAENNRDSMYGLFFLDSGSTLTIKAGVTLENIAARVVNIRAGATVNMEGGLITGNTAGKNEYYGGDRYTGTANAGAAVYICPNGTFVMSGGTITGNYSTVGGAVYAENGGTFKVSGTAKVYGNYTSSTSTQGADVYLGNYGGKLATIKITGALTEDAKIGVYTQIDPTSSAYKDINIPIAESDGSYNVQNDDAKYFFSNKPTAAGIGYENNKVVIGAQYAEGKFKVEGVDGVDAKGYEKLAGALSAATPTDGDKKGTVTITDPSVLTTDENGTLPNGVSIKDPNGNVFKGTAESTGEGGGTGVTVQAKTGKVTVTSGSATVTPGETNVVDFGVGSYDVTVSGDTDGFNVTAPAGESSGKIEGVTGSADVTIDGITYSGATSYNLENTFSSAEGNITATVPAGKTLTVDEDTEIKASGNEITVTKSKGTGEDDAKTVVDIPAGSSATIDGKVYNGPAKVELDSGGSATVQLPDIYVSAEGDDNNPGTKDKPYATLYKAFTAANTGNGANIHVLTDITMDKTVFVSSGKTVTLIGEKADDNEKVTVTVHNTVTLASNSYKDLFRVNSSASLTLTNIILDGSGESYNSKLESVLDGASQNAQLTVGDGCEIRNFNMGTSARSGYAVPCVIDMSESSSNGNTANRNGKLNMNEGSKITGCTANRIISVGSGSTANVNATITGNTAGGSSGYVILVGVAANTNLTLSGAVIEDNTVTDGAIRTGVFQTVSGATVIEGNSTSGGVEKNLVINGSNYVTASGLTEGAHIGITVPSIKSGVKFGTEDTAGSNAKYFFSDASGYYATNGDTEGSKDLVLKTAVYTVTDESGTRGYSSWSELTEKESELTVKNVTLVGTPKTDDTVDLSGGWTLTDAKTGDKYTGVSDTNSDSKITVNKDGSISVPEPSEGKTKNSVALTPGDSTKGATVKTGENDANTHTVAGPTGGSVEITVEKKADGGSSISATAKDTTGGTDETKKGVIIDGVTYTGGEDSGIDLDNPFGGTGSVTAEVPDGKTVTVPGGEESGSKGFTVTNPANSEDDNITVTAPGTDGVKGTVTSKEGGKVSVKAGDNAAVNYELGEKGTLNLKHDNTESGKGDYVELESGSVTVPNGGKITANDKDMTVTGGSVTVEKGKPNENDVTVTVPSGGSFTVDGKTYTGATTVVIGADGTIEEVLPDYYVNASAEAGGNGSLEKPFKTVQEAVAEGNKGKGAHIHIMSDINTASTISITASGKSFDFDSVDESGSASDTAHTVKITSSANTTALMEIKAGNVTVKNLVLDGNKDRSISMDYGHHIVVNGTNATLTLGYGAKVTGFNEGTTKGGNCNGAVTVVYGTLIMLDGAEISGNQGPYGAGVKVGSIDDGAKAYSGTFRMDGGKITGNTTTANGTSYGGAVYLWGSSAANAKLIMTGGEITGNTNTYGSGSVAGVTNYQGTVTVSGDATISGNTCADGSASDLYTTEITIDGELTGKIGFIGSNTRVSTKTSDYAKNAVANEKLFADDESMKVVYNDGTAKYIGQGGTLTQVVSDKASSTGIWLVSDATIPTVYVGGEVSNPSAEKGTKENPYQSFEDLVENSGKLNNSVLTVVLGEDMGATADQLEELMDGGRKLTVTSPDQTNKHTLTVNPGAESGNKNVDIGGNLTLKDVNVTAGNDVEGNLFTVKDGGSLTMDGVTLSGAANTDKQRGVYVEGGAVTLKDTEIKGFDASGITGETQLDGKGSGVYMKGGDITLSGKVNISENGGSSNNSNVYLAENQTLTADGMTTGSVVGLDTADNFGAMGSRTAVKGVQAGEDQFFKSDMSNHGMFYQNGTVAFGPQGERVSYYVREDGAEWTSGGNVGTSSNPIKPSEMDKVSGTLIDFFIMGDITLPKTSNTTNQSNNGNYGMRIVGTQFRIVSVYNAGTDEAPNWVQVTDPNDTAHIHTIYRDSSTGTGIPNGAPMFWNVGGGGIELAYVNIADAKVGEGVATLTHGPVIRASRDDKHNTTVEGEGQSKFTNTGDVVLTGVTITGSDYSTGSTSYGTAGTVIDFESEGGTLTLTDTTINGLKVGTNGAVYVGTYSGATVAPKIIVDGSTTVTGNTSGSDAKNVYLNGVTVTVNPGFKGKVGVSVQGEIKEDTTEVGKLADGTDPTAYAKYFSSDNAEFIVKANGEKTMLVFGKGIYQVGDEFFQTWDDVKNYFETNPNAADKTVHLIGNPQTNDETADLGTDITLVDDATGDKYTGGKVTVNKDSTQGNVTVTGDGKTTFTPGADSKGASVKYGSDTEKSKNVTTPDGKSVDIDITSTGATAGTGDKSDNVVIDGVTYSNSEKYDLDDPLSSSGAKATVPSGKSAAIPGTEGKVTVENSGTGNLDITSLGASGESRANLTLDNGESATVKKSGDSAGTKYTGKQDGTHLELDSEGNATLTAGSVGVPKNGKVKVNKKDVTNKGDGEIVVTMDQPSKDFAQVEVPAGGSITVGEQEFKGPVTVVIDKDGNPYIYEGSVELKPDESGEGDSVKVGFSDGNTVDVQNVDKAEPADDNSVTVTMPSATDENKGSAKIPNGGEVKIGGENGKTYDATAENTVFDFDSEGNVDITAGGTALTDGESIGFGSAELGNDSTAGDPTNEGIKVEVKDDKADVTVPKGETFSVTVTDEDGEKHTYTYKNNGDGELHLTVDKDGNVSVNDLPSGGLDLGPNAPITVTDTDGGNENPLIAGENGATLKPNKENTSNPPLLDSGSIIFPEEGGSSKVVIKDSKGENVEKKLEGSNVEITVTKDSEGKNTVTAKSTEGDVAGQVTVEGGTEYTLPADPNQEATLNENGVFGKPAMGRIKDNKDGPGSDLPFVLSPKNENQELYTVEEETLTDTQSGVHMEPGSSFDMYKKTEGNNSKEDSNLNKSAGSLGHYEGAGEGAEVTVDHQKGTVELTDGSVHIGGNKEPEGASVETPLVVDGQTITSSDATVTKTKDESGKDTGADVTVPAGGSFTVKGEAEDGSKDKTYTVPEAKDGGRETTFHVDENGNVELTDGSAELGEGDTVNVGDVTFGDSSGGGSDKTTVTVPSPAGNGKTRVEVEGGGSVTVTAPKGSTDPEKTKKYENGDEDGNTDLVLDVDNDGNVELNQGSVKLPDGGEVDVTTGDGEHHVEGDGITVTKDTQNSNTAKVGVDNFGEGATDEKKVTIDDTEYTVPQGSTAEFEIGGEKSPELTGGKIELDAKGDPAPTENESVSVNGATVEATGDGTGETDKKVTVEVDKDGTGKVTIPDGGSANVNGVEVKGPADVKIDKDGNAKVTPGKDKNNVTVGGIEYNEKVDTETGSVSIAPDGKVKSENMTPTVKGPTNGPVYVAPGEIVHFETEDGEKKTQVSGGTNGGWVKVDEEGNIILTDETGEEEYGKYYNADSSENPKDLELTVDGQNAELTGGTVHVDGDDSITVNGHDYTAGKPDGMTMTYGESEGSTVPELTGGTVNPDPNAPVKVGDNTYTPKSENVEVGMGDSNGSVKSSDGNDAEVGFKGNDAGTDKEYLIPGAETVKPTTGTDSTDAKLPSPAQEKLSEESTELGEDGGATVKAGSDNGKNGKGDAYLELDESGEEHKLTLKPGASADVTDKDEKTTAKFENTGDTDAHMTLDKDGNATLTDGTVKMTGGEEPNTDAGVKVKDEKSGKDVTITSKEATVTAPGTDSNGSKNGADVTVPAGGSFTVKGDPDKTYKGGTDDTTFHVNPDGTVELKDGSTELSKDDTLKFGDTTITGSGDSTDSKTTVTVPAAEGSENAKVEVEQGTDNSVKVGDNTYTNGSATDDLELEVTPEGNVELDSGAVKLPENGSVDVTAGAGESTKDYSVEGKDVTVEKDKDSGKVTVPKNSDETGKNSVEITDTDGNIHNYTNEGNGELEVELTPDGPAITGGTAGVPKDDEIIVPGGGGNNTVVENTGDEDITVTPSTNGRGGTVTVPKNGGSANFTSKDADGTEHKNSVEAPDGNDVKVEVGNDGTLTVKPEKGEDGKSKVTVNGKTYTTDDENANLKVEPDGTVTMDPTGSFSVEVEKPASGEPDKDVHLNPGESVNVGENTVTGDYPNGADLSVDSRGDVTLKDGTVKLPAHAEGAQPNNVEVEFSDGSKVHVTNPSVKGADETGKDVTVTAPDATTGKAKAEVPAGGEVSIGGATYDVPAGTGNTTFEFGKDGKAAITDGSVNLDDNEKVGFGNVELGNGGTDTDTSNDITVEVTGAGDDKKADVTVPAGETFTVKGADGKEHTYKNNGEGNLELTVDKDGNVTVKEGTSLPADGVELNGGTTLTVGDDTLTSGDKGATLKPDSTGSGAPVLDKGSVKLPEDKDTSVKVKTGTGTDGDAYTEFTGKNVEVFADASDAGKTGTNPAVKGGPGGGTVSTDSNKAYIPEDEVSVYENGNFDTPAVSELDGYKDVGKYVIVPDSDNKTSNKHIYDQSTDSGNESDLVLDNGAGFEVKEKGTGEATGNSVGHYEAASDNTQVTVDGDDGSVTLTDGSLNVSGDGKAGSKGAAVKVGENVIETKNATVTAAEDADGKPDGGADVTVPAGGNFTVKGNPDKTYKGGTGDTTYHVDAEGNVTLKEGTVELGNGESVGFGDTTITGSGDSTAPKTTVTVPAAEGSKNAKVEVEKGTDNGVKVGDNTYTNGSNTDALELEVTPKGEVELKDGTVKLPENGAVDVTAGTGDDAKDYTVETGKDGKDVTVEKNGSNATVTVPKDGNVTVTDKNGEGAGDDKTNTYTNKGTGNLEVELTPDGPVLDEGKAGLGENSELGVKTTDGSVIPVESTGNGSNGDQVTVEKNGTNTVVDIPDGGSAKVNGVEVKGPAKVTIDEATGEATVESTGTNNKSVTVGGVEYTDDPDTAGEGSVTIAPDGHVEAEGMTGKIPDDAELPIKDLHIPANGTLTYEVNGSEVELIGGENGATVDIGSNGDVTGKAGDVTVKGDVNAKVDKNAKPDTQVHQVGDVTFHVEDRNKGNVEGAQVTVVVTDNDGNEYTGTTDSAGNVTIEDIPYGVYSVVVTVEEGDETYTSTGSVTVDSANKDSTSEPFMIDAEITVNTSVNSDLEKAPSVGNLHSAAEEDIKDVDGGTKVQVDIELKANKLDRNSSSGMNSAKVGEIKDRITGEAGVRGSVTDFVDITVTKKVTTESGGDTTVSSQKMTETPLLTITFPVPAGILDKLAEKDIADELYASFIFLIRDHENVASRMTKVTKSYGERTSSECYYVYELGGNWYITIKAAKFSVYAFGVLETAEAPSNGNNTGGIGGGSGSTGGVTTGESKHGTVIIVPEEPETGDTDTVIGEPDKGYDFSGVEVLDRNGKPVDVTKNADGTYSFVMPAGGVTVTGIFTVCPSMAYTDLDLAKWYHQYTDYAIANGLMQGIGGGKFAPDHEVTRAQMVTILWILEDKPVVNYLMPFTDMTEDKWYSEAVRWASSEQVVLGFGDDTFRPEVAITREQMALLLSKYDSWKYGTEKPEGVELSFTDAANVSGWASDAVAWGAESGYINGYGDNTFKPKATTTRVHLATIMSLYHKAHAAEEK